MKRDSNRETGAYMRRQSEKISTGAKVAAALLCFAIIASAVAFIYIKNQSSGNIVTEDVTAETGDISRYVTAAGEVVTAEEEKIDFSTSKRFKAMCVEIGEKVSEGQHLIMYSNGTYEDAPADGFVTAISAPRSGYYASSSNYITFAYADKLQVDITVPESEINDVETGNKAEIVVNSDTSKVYSGVIGKKKAISTTRMSGDTGSSGSYSQGGGMSPFGSDSSIAYYTVSLTFDNDGTVLPGMSAICTITISEKNGILTVPVEAVRFDDEGNTYVVTVDGGSTENVYVTIGDSDADKVEIKEGLSEGATVRIERKG